MPPLPCLKAPANRQGQRIRVTPDTAFGRKTAPPAADNVVYNPPIIPDEAL